MHGFQFTALPLALPESRPGGRGGLEEERKTGCLGAVVSLWSVPSCDRGPSWLSLGVFYRRCFHDPTKDHCAMS